MWLDVKLGLRMLRKHWALTLIGGLALTAAMTMAAAGFNLSYALLGTSVPLEEGDRVVIVQSFERWKEGVRSLVDVGAFRTVDHEMTTSGLAQRVIAAEMSAAGFALARINPQMGRFLQREDEQPGAPPVVVIGYDAWQSTFAADRSVVGRQVQLDGVSHTVVGVMPKGFRFPVSHQYWISLQAKPSDRITVFARLSPGATLESAQVELDALGFSEPGVIAQSRRPQRPLVRPYIVGLTGERGGIPTLLPFALPLLLILPCINIGALIYARTVARQGEFAARAALGATRTRIIVQIFLEVLVLAVAAAAVALVLAPKVAELISHMFMTYDLPFWMDFGVSYGSILFSASMAVVAAYLAGAIPARRAIERGLITGLSALHRSSPPQLGKAWTAIVVAQLALSVAVLPIAVEMAWTMLRPAVLGPGFPVKEFLTARLDLAAGADPAAASARFKTLSNEVVRQLSAEPGVTAVTMSAYKPFAEENLSVQTDSSGSEQSHVSVAFNQVDAAFFHVFGIRLLAGRGFEAVDNDPQRGTLLVNRSFANRVFGNENPLGRAVRVLGSNGPIARYEIVGLVDNQFAHSDQPTIYRPLTFVDVRSVHLAIHTGPALVSGFESRLREITSAAASDLRVDDVQPLDEIYFFLSLPGYIMGSGPTLVALGVLVFAIVGIYTRMSFDVVQRRREIGIRSALGASPQHLVVGMFRSVFVPVLIGGGLGGVAALVLNFYLSPLLFSSGGGRPLPWILPGVEAFILVMGAVAVSGPVRRTLRVDATEALRDG